MCDACRHAGTNQRLVDVASIDPDALTVQSAEVSADSSVLRVAWREPSAEAGAPSQEHLSEYPMAWLREHSPLKSSCRIVDRGTITWDAAVAGALPAADFGAVMNDDAALLRALTAFKEYGKSQLLHF